MTKIEYITYSYMCDVCGTTYNIAAKAMECEAIPVTQDKGVKKGDIVLAKIREWHEPSKFKVLDTFIIPKWHFGYDVKYHHTVGLKVCPVSEISEEFLSRPLRHELTFDQYKIDPESVAKIRNVKI